MRSAALITSAFVSLILFASSGAAQGIDPAPLKIVDELHNTIVKLQKEDPRLAKATQTKLGQAFDAVTHFEEIAEEVLEPYAEGWTIGEWRQLSKKLGAVIRADTLWVLKPYRVDRFEITGTDTIFRTVVVKAKAVHGAESTPLTYYLNREDGVWYIVNYKVDTADLVEGYQNHYDSLFKGGFLQPIVDQLERDVLTHPSRTGQ